jgi:hypothetical protein
MLSNSIELGIRRLYVDSRRHEQCPATTTETATETAKETATVTPTHPQCFSS